MDKSFSEPNTPLKEKLVVTDKWQNASCSDIGKDVEISNGNPLIRARRTTLRQKREAISAFLKLHQDEDLLLYKNELRTFAISPGGLVDDEFRAVIWPILAESLIGEEDTEDDNEFINYDSIDIDEVNQLSIDDLKEHKEWHQVELDVNRTLARFPPNISESHRDVLQTELIPLIVRVLSINPKFKYYQGFHDICLTILLVCGQETSLEVCSNLAKYGSFNNYLRKTLETTILKDLDLMYVILSRVDPQLESIMRSVSLGTIFALSWSLTWFSHSLQQYQQIVRFFDCFLASPPLLPIYVSSAIVLYRKESILSCEREMPYIHRLLTEMPSELPIDAILQDAVYMSTLMPPRLLKTRYLDEYKKTVSTPLVVVRSIPRYTLQFVVAVGAMAGYLYFKQM